MKKRRIISSVMALMASAAIFAGCAASSKLIFFDDDKPEEVTDITFYGFKADDLDFIAMENILHGFMRENAGLQVSYEGVKGQAYWDAFELRGKKGSNNKDTLDDIIMMDQAHALTYHDRLANIENAIDLNLFNDLVKEQIKKDDGVFFVPMTLASYCLYINYDLLDQYNQPVPKNYAEFAAVCDKFKEIYAASADPAVRELAPVICNNRRALCTVVQGRSLYDVYVGDNTNADMAYYNTHPEEFAEKLGDGLRFVESLFANGYIDPDKTFLTEQTSILGPEGYDNGSIGGDMWLFSQGKQPFMISGGWAPQRLRKVLDDNNKTMKFGVHPYPIIEKEGDGSVLVMDINNCVAVNKNSENLEDAKKLITYLTKPESIWEYCDGQCCFSPLKNETRTPTDKSVMPTADYYQKGKAVIGTNYQLDVSLDAHLMTVTKAMCKGYNKTGAEQYRAAEAIAKLKELLKKEVSSR